MDPNPDPAILVLDLQDTNKKNIFSVFLHIAFWQVLRIRIRIHWIHMFLGLLDPDPSVRGMDPDPDLDSFITKQKKLEKPWFLLLCDSFWLFIFENDVYVCTFKK